MKKILAFFFLSLIFTRASGQYVRTDHSSFSAQELIENILFTSNCAEDIQIDQTISGNFNDGMLSYGFFENVNSNFPFESGIVLTTGRLSNVDGPNTSLSDDNAPNWTGDNDLENNLGISGTTNATVMSFRFTPNAPNISFNYIFASEEYQENNPNTCFYSDAFAFLIRPVGAQDYQNIAVIPNTQTPVLVTTVRPEIPGACEALNEEYFGQFNEENASINFNGQTAVLSANTEVIPNQQYEIKLVIADEQNHRYDSAVFLEANSFNISFDLGNDRTGENSLCESEELRLQIPENLDTNPVTWFYNGVIIPNENTSFYTVSEEEYGQGVYSAEIDLGNGCISTDSIEINFATATQAGTLNLTQCISNNSDVEFNLNSIIQQLISQNLNLTPLGYYESRIDAENDTNAIETPSNYTYTENQNVYVRLANLFGCVSISEIELFTNSTLFPEVEIEKCSPIEENTISFDILSTLNQIRNETGFLEQPINLYGNQTEAANAQNPITGTTVTFERENLPSIYYARTSNIFGCEGLIPVRFDTKTSIDIDEPIVNLTLCKEDTSIILETNLNENEYNFTWNDGSNSSNLEVTEAGIYEVIIDYINAPDQNCSAIKIFEVNISSIAEIDYILYGTIGNYSIEIIAEGEGDYEYALNESNFQDEAYFYNLDALNTIKVRDKQGCGINQKSFTTIIFPEFFSPNQDGINDIWLPEGLDNSNVELISIQIFDRYGKLIFVLKENSLGWNGNYNGKQMPQNEYWYKANFKNHQSIKGSFTLKR